MRSNPAVYRGVAARKGMAQAGAYRAVWQDLKRRMSRYKTVPVVAEKAKQIYESDIRPGVVYALKIGNAISQDAFTVYDDALSVAQALANRYDMQISVVDKKTKVARKTVGSKKRSAASFVTNPEPRMGEHYFTARGHTYTFRSQRAAMTAAQREADATGKRIQVYANDWGEVKEPYKAKAKRTYARNPAKRYYTLAVREDGVWSPQFGDYDRSTVAQEIEDMADGYGGPKKKDMKIVVSGDKQADINAAIRALNGS